MTESEPWSYHADGSPVYSLADIIRKRATATPDAIALAEMGRLTSFAALDRRSSQVAQALQAGGVRPGDRVAFIGANGPEFTEVGYGAAKCRAIFTAVNNRLAAPEILGILADAEPRVLVVDPAAAPLVTRVGAFGFDCAVLVTGDSYLSWRDAAPAEDSGEVADPDETALILYMRLLVDRKVTHAAVVPTVLQRLLALPECKTADWSALSHVVYGASPIPLPVLRAATEVIGCSFLQSYGLTESTGGFTLLGPADHVP
jgi:acyl-CoA synthetase (AMP-forming)/AMP-acid ligase II